jgi:hypothetical protein
MPGVSVERVAAAKAVDLLSYLQATEPWELRRSRANEYRTVSHGSLVISKGMWYWNRGGFGGKSALDYLIKVRGMGFVDAVETVLGSRAASASLLPVKMPEPQSRKAFTLPPPARFPAHAVSYLQGRGIRGDPLKTCLSNGTVYESRDGGKAVCVFVGHDNSSIPRFAHLRGIHAKYHRDTEGSDKRFSFSLPAKRIDSPILIVTESPIDALSHACLFPELDAWRLSLGGTSDIALTAFLEHHPQITGVSLCLDGDVAGQTAARKIQASLAISRPDIAVTIDPPEQGKDYNDMLLHVIRQEREDRVSDRHSDGFISF